MSSENVQLKMSFKRDSKKQALELYLSHKIVSDGAKQLSLNQSQIKMCKSHKHLGLILDTKLTKNILRTRLISAKQSLFL